MKRTRANVTGTVRAVRVVRFASSRFGIRLSIRGGGTVLSAAGQDYLWSYLFIWLKEFQWKWPFHSTIDCRPHLPSTPALCGGQACEKNPKNWKKHRCLRHFVKRDLIIWDAYFSTEHDERCTSRVLLQFAIRGILPTGQTFFVARAVNPSD